MGSLERDYRKDFTQRFTEEGAEIHRDFLVSLERDYRKGFTQRFTKKGTVYTEKYLQLIVLYLLISKSVCITLCYFYSFAN